MEWWKSHWAPVGKNNNNKELKSFSFSRDVTFKTDIQTEVTYTGDFFFDIFESHVIYVEAKRKFLGAVSADGVRLKRPDEDKHPQDDFETLLHGGSLRGLTADCWSDVWYLWVSVASDGAKCSFYSLEGKKKKKKRVGWYRCVLAETYFSLLIMRQFFPFINCLVKTQRQKVQWAQTDLWWLKKYITHILAALSIKGYFFNTFF